MLPLMLASLVASLVVRVQLEPHAQRNDVNGAAVPQDRGRRLYRTTTAPKFKTKPPLAFTTTTTTQTTASSGPSTTPSIPVEIAELYDIFPRSAINMMGQTSLVNYNRTKGSVLEAMKRCYNDPLCVSFDHNLDDNEAWTHRIPAICAEFVGASFMDGTTGPTTKFYQLKVEVLTSSAPGRVPGMWDWLNNFTIPGARDELPPAVRKSEEMQAELEGHCGVNDQAKLATPGGTGMAWLRAFGTLVGALIISGLLIFFIMKGTKRVQEQRELQQVLNPRLDADNNNFDDSDSSDDDDDEYSDEDDVDPRDNQPQAQAEVHALLPHGEPAGVDGRDLGPAMPHHNGAAEGGCID